MAKNPMPTGPQWLFIIAGAGAAAAHHPADRPRRRDRRRDHRRRRRFRRDPLSARRPGAQEARRADERGPAPSELAGAAAGRVRQPLYAGAQILARRREGGGQAHLPGRQRVVPRARSDAARARSASSSSARIPITGPARRTACASRSGPASRSRPASSTSTRRWRPISASRRRGTASSNIGRSRACCC